MKYFNIKTLATVFAAATLLSSCDSGGTDTLEGTDIAEALDTPAAGDVFSFTSNTLGTTLNNLTFDGSTALDQVSLDSYTYTRTGERTFELTNTTIDGTADTTAFNTIVTNLITNNSNFAQLLALRTEADFTEDELTEFLQIMNAAGANITGDDVDDLVISGPSSFTCLVTSNITDQIGGSLGGLYIADNLSRTILFAPATSAELALFNVQQSGFTAVMPTLSTESEIEEDSDLGSWVLDLD